MKSDISKVITKLTDYNPSYFIRGDWQLVHMWIAQGCDMDKDILPAIDEMMQRNPKITSVAYFAPLVLRKRDNRLDTDKAATSKPQSANKDAAKAQAIAWKLRKIKMHVGDHDKIWLAQYEAVHGATAV